MEQTDSELFQRRTIPPIPGITQGGRGTAELTGYHPTNEEEDIEDEKEKEAEAERELQEEHAVSYMVTLELDGCTLAHTHTHAHAHSHTHRMPFQLMNHTHKLGPPKF